MIKNYVFSFKTSKIFVFSTQFSDIPVAVSFPHFYGGDPSLVENVNGISPDKEKHESIVAIQPVMKI